MNRKRKIAGILIILGIIGLMLNWQKLVFSTICFARELYSKDFYEKNFEIENGKIYRKDPSSDKRYLVKRTFYEDFENATSLGDLIGIERGWTNFTLLSPKAPTIADYNKLRKQILTHNKDFLDNRLEPSSQQSHLGKQSLKAVAVAPNAEMVCTKSSLHTSLMYFVKGDDVWFSAWYYFEKAGKFNTLMDLETTFVHNHPGMRIRLSKGYLDFELAKWFPKSIYRQPKGKKVSFPIGRWVHVKAHLFLSDKKDGVIQLWQDDTLIIYERGQTLPFAKAVYDDLEIGISAHSVGPDSAILYVDDAMISAEQSFESIKKN
ncbi:MAG: heparin lyase I family protein [Phycisphaeraceae bacterium]|nr:heparin lyase I family protein [Phycisphaeraceae bacterium]